MAKGHRTATRQNNRTVPFLFDASIQEDWIDYNGHMRDAYYGLVFSYAVDALQDAVGFDAEYRARTGATIYLVEDHKRYLKEVHAGARVQVETVVLGVTDKAFHLHMTMRQAGVAVCIGEFLELHVRQKPAPHAVPMPQHIRASLEAALADRAQRAALPGRARPIALKP